jgi:hypothetical protein
MWGGITYSVFILEDAAIKRKNGWIYGNSGHFFSFYTTLMKGDSLYNIDITKFSSDSTQRIHNGCIIPCHVSCLTLQDGNLSYFVFGRQTWNILGGFSFDGFREINRQYCTTPKFKERYQIPKIKTRRTQNSYITRYISIKFKMFHKKSGTLPCL